MSFHEEDHSTQYGIIKDIDEDGYLAKVQIHPTGQLTGFIPIATTAHGILAMPSIGMMVKVDFMMNNMSHAVITQIFYEKEFSANKKLPKNHSHVTTTRAKEKWYIHRHPPSGAEWHFNDKGDWELYSPGAVITYAEGQYYIKTPKVHIDSEEVHIGNLDLQQLVTKAWLDEIYANHFHIGNLGAPTPLVYIPGVEGHHWTKQTKAS